MPMLVYASFILIYQVTSFVMYLTKRNKTITNRNLTKYYYFCTHNCYGYKNLIHTKDIS